MRLSFPAFPGEATLLSRPLLSSPPAAGAVGQRRCATRFSRPGAGFLAKTISSHSQRDLTKKQKTFLINHHQTCVIGVQNVEAVMCFALLFSFTTRHLHWWQSDTRTRHEGTSSFSFVIFFSSIVSFLWKRSDVTENYFYEGEGKNSEALPWSKLALPLVHVFSCSMRSRGIHRFQIRQVGPRATWWSEAKIPPSEEPQF